LESPVRGQVPDPVDASGAFAAVVLRYPPDRQAARRPGGQQEVLQPMNCFAIVSACGLIDAGLELEDLSFDCSPIQVIPFIH
jgi:hypothetical protein